MSVGIRSQGALAVRTSMGAIRKVQGQELTTSTRSSCGLIVVRSLRLSFNNILVRMRERSSSGTTQVLNGFQ
jgi:hypothetical protein